MLGWIASWRRPPSDPLPPGRGSIGFLSLWPTVSPACHPFFGFGRVQDAFKDAELKETAKAPRRVGGERQPFPESIRIAVKKHPLFFGFVLFGFVVSFFRLVNGDGMNNPGFLCFRRHFSWRLGVLGGSKMTLPFPCGRVARVLAIDYH